MAETPPDARRRNECARNAILDATVSLIGEVGYANVSIEAIARRAGVGKQTIYRWWPSKGAVVLDAATRSLDPVVLLPDTGDFLDDVRAQLKGIVERIADTGFGAAYRGVIAAGQSDDTLLEAVFDRIIEPNVGAFVARAARARDRDEIRADADVETLADVLYGFVEFRLLHALPVDPRHIDALVELAFRGVR
ncbi:TetR/AcrR family transcriptional regulator [Mycolicibacterium brumae]|uniref:TetR family transcriptional regulator n=1 Tax=Mycolicibacterium brumae TaxID=85968 RepID=A0A2G5PG39_9MYCO|nr:TetR/AcrR family transcriptional regulator [Mycolicibacterium brumae]MCV7194332.1 TetR/AcrR family transcriptional regulator [Mycolicibacterium brumae]PIB77267.1 TetR family transcriptional regulator [Mycolicibacterium brumae]RWA15520.1 hypothetical protein MBRU_10745 [Mycolicibacterium brumae DSM 44177]UWW10631.1 TetR/AcrR family transcriptional regulator [Mycolicibacterium brumae]